MKTLFLIPLILTPLLSTAKSVSELADSYGEKRSEITSENEAALSKLNKGYLNRLAKIQASIQKSGKLAMVEMIEAEISEVKLGTWPLHRVTTSSPSPLKKARKLYEKARFDISKKRAVALVSSTDIMLKLLGEEKITATQKGALDEARAARALARFKKSGSEAPVALRLRRYGDQIEVLVYYDAAGKVSLKSTIKNTIEETGGRKERGDTTATTLGEFVGAPGYQVDPYIALNHNFGKAGDGVGAAQSDFEKNLRYKVGGESGLQLTLIDKPINPYYAIKNLFPPLTAPGSYRVSCSYYIPTGNKALDGFALYQGGGVRIGEHAFTKRGEWTSHTVEGSSHTQETILRLYPVFKVGQKMIDAAGESLVLGSLKVEHIRFSAFIHSRFNESGELTESFPALVDQELFIKNGKILSN